MPALMLASILLAACIAPTYRSSGLEPWTPPADMDQDLNAFLEYLAIEGLAWIRSQRESLRPGAAALRDEQRARLAPYFEAETLDAVRYRLVERIGNPDFYADLAVQGIEAPLDFSRMAGITFIDTIAIALPDLTEQALIELLFHEAVHVAQYRYLGEAAFVERYVQGWADNGFDYFSIPLERQAYALQGRFETGEVFSVEAYLEMVLTR
jgi:hypothetical protein